MSSTWFTSRAAMKRALYRVQGWYSSESAAAAKSSLLLAVAFIAFARGAALLSVRLWYESLSPYNGDTPLYWTVGRGILHGLIPYRDLYETKPPGIFLVSALSFLLTSGFGLTHVTQILSLLFLALSPSAFVPRLLRARTATLACAPIFFALWALVLLIASFVADRGSGVQVEVHGVVGVVAYALLLAKPGRLAFLGRALAAAACIGMKEPFLLTLTAVFLVMAPSARRLWSDFIGPLALASVVGSLFLIGFGWFSAYTQIYLKSMLGTHVELSGSPISRITLALNLTWNDMQAYSALLPATLLYCMGVYVFRRDSLSAEGAEFVSRRFQALVLGLLLVGLAVGMGGTFYDHHYIFAVPFLVAVLFVLMKRLIDRPDAHAWLQTGFVLLTLATVWTKWTPPQTFELVAAQIAKQDEAARESAKVIDSVLDRLRVDRYLYLGPGGYVPYPYTRHAPLGPLFFQQVTFFAGQYPWLVSQFRRRLHEAQVVIMHQHMTGPLDDEVRAELAAEFQELPKSSMPAGVRAQDPILIRKGLQLR